MPNRIRMKKEHITELLVFLNMNLAAVLIIAAITNPIEEQHQKAAASFKADKLGESGINRFAGEFSGKRFRPDIAPGIAKYKIRSQNLLFFSLTKTAAGDIIGIGAFGHVFVFANTPFDN